MLLWITFPEHHLACLWLCLWNTPHKWASWVTWSGIGKGHGHWHVSLHGDSPLTHTLPTSPLSSYFLSMWVTGVVSGLRPTPSVGIMVWDFRMLLPIHPSSSWAALEWHGAQEDRSSKSGWYHRPSKDSYLPSHHYLLAQGSPGPETPVSSTAFHTNWNQAFWNDSLTSQGVKILEVFAQEKTQQHFLEGKKKKTMEKRQSLNREIILITLNNSVLQTLPCVSKAQWQAVLWAVLHAFPG